MGNRERREALSGVARGKKWVRLCCRAGYRRAMCGPSGRKGVCVKIEIKHGLTASVLFSHEAENNTIKITLEAGVKIKANLGCADLRGANLGGANLGGADLGGANLVGADLGDKENPIEDIKQIGPIGSRSDYTICFKLKKSIEIHCGCFRGSFDEFQKKVVDTYKPEEKHGKEYRALIQFIKTLWLE